MGILFTFQTAERSNSNWPGLAYFSVSLSLNVLLILMIVIRLILHTKNTRNALGIAGIGGLCKTVVTMLIESCALYAVGSVLVIVLEYFYHVTRSHQTTVHMVCAL